MRILLICYVYPPEVAPAGVMVRELAEDLAARGHPVTVQTGWPNHPAGVLPPGWRARWRRTQIEGNHRLQRVLHAFRPKSSPLGRLWYYFTFAASSLANGLTLGRHDAVVCLSTPIFGVWSAWALARLWRAKFVNVIFDLWPEAIRNAGLTGESLPYHILRRIDTLNCKVSDEITTLGESMRAEILARGIRGEKVHVLPFWVDAERIRPLDRDNPWRRRHEIAPEQFVALFAGTVGYASGAEILADVAERLRDRPDILLLIVGEGVAKRDLEQLATQRNLPNLRFMGFQHEDDLSAMQSSADAGLVTLRADAGQSSVPSKVLGYMAAGRAVIASADDESETARVVRAGRFGVVTPAQDAAALADALRSLADDRPRCEQLGRRAREYLLEHFARTAVVQQYVELIER